MKVVYVRNGFALALLLASVGCTSVQLRNNTLSQAEAVHQVQQQQVLDNLAMFVVNPNAVPFFSIAGGWAVLRIQSGECVNYIELDPLRLPVGRTYHFRK